jgi:phosphoesterase RecJ-like protein
VLKALTRELTVEIGTALLAGMTTDTNNFANSVFPSTLQMASELLALGVDRDALLVQLYQSYRENRVRLMGYMQSEQLHILPNGTAYMILTRDIQQRFGLLDGESEGLVNVPLSIGPVKLSVLLKEDVGHFRVSVRSKKGTSAQQLALRHFHGGGHENAAGGKLFIGQDIACPEEASAYIEQVLKDFLA